MKILTRYVVFDLLKVFSMILTGLTVVIFIGLIGKEAVEKGLGLGPLLRMTPYLLPQAMQFAVPGTMLLATTYVYGRLSSYNEIVAIKALGISPMALIWPTLILATLVSFSGVYINNLAVSWGTRGVQRVFIESIEDVVYGHLQMHRTYSSGKLSINVRGVEGKTLRQPTLVVAASGNHPALTIRAKEAEISSDPKERKLHVRFRDFEVSGPITVTNPETYEQEISLDELTGMSAETRSPSTYALGEIGPAVERTTERIRQLDESMAAQASFALMTGEILILAPEHWKWREKELAGAKERLQRLHTEPWRRWANGFSCLCFVMVGAPMAIRLKHAEFLAIFFVCFLPILLVYYPMLAVSVDQAKDGAFPPPAVWLGNVVLALWGVWLMRRVIRY
jgi:lipopolysaccharide export system permease protein